MAWRFGKSNISRYNRLEYLTTEETSEVGGNLLRKSGAIVVHRQQNALDSEGRVNGAAETHKRIEQLGNAFKREVFTLDGYKDRVTGG